MPAPHRHRGLSPSGNRPLLSHGFDRLAPFYGLLERCVACGLLQRARLEWIDSVQAANVLLVGEGHGRFLSPLSSVLPQARITCVDASRGMLAVARRRLEKLNPSAIDRVEWIHASLPDWHPPPSTFDLVVTNFFLDCFDGELLERVVGRIAAGSTATGQWILTDFAMPSLALPRLAARASLWTMYRFFRATTRLPARSLDYPAPHLQAHGFRNTRTRDRLWGFLTSQLWRRGPSPYRG